MQSLAALSVTHWGAQGLDFYTLWIQLGELLEPHTMWSQTGSGGALIHGEEEEWRGGTPGRRSMRWSVRSRSF